MTTRILPGRHGYGPYSHGLCHCDVCRRAGREYRAKQRARHLLSADLVHGRRATYDCGCRCEECVAVRTAAYRSNEAAS